MSKKIKFIISPTSEHTLFPPKPSSKELPNWYKNTPSYIDDQGKKWIDQNHPSTIKGCIPVFDALTAGYILYTSSDLQVTQKNGETEYLSRGKRSIIELHGLNQAPLHPLKNGNPYPKWINPYGIKTPRGYSTLFTMPMHRESVFTIFSGIVDTDKYSAAVHFPFVLKDPKWEGIIPAGTPMAQAIPFKRDFWKYEICSDEYNVRQKQIDSNNLMALLFNSYKKQFWSSKQYK